jgi:frataxin-like iron-binding protein CyaY
VCCVKHAYSESLAVFWITEHGGCLLCRLTTRRMYAVSSYNAEMECWILSQRGGCHFGASHNAEGVCWVLSQGGGCIMERLTTRRLYPLASNNAEVVPSSVSQRGGCTL